MTGQVRCYNAGVLSKRFFVLIFLASVTALAQQGPAAKKQQVKINYLNVCTPSEEEIRELSAALATIPDKTKFAPDFEVSRGRSTLSEPPVALDPASLTQAGPVVQSNDSGVSNWARVRREFPAGSPFVSVQYSMSLDPKYVVETLVFRLREVKDVIQISLEDRVSGGSNPALILKTDTPVDRVRIERFGKSSVALARCPSADQKSYEPIFQQASAALMRYRTALNVRSTVPADLRRLGVGATTEKKNSIPSQHH